MFGLNPTGLGVRISLACLLMGCLWVGSILYGINGIYGQAPIFPAWFVACYGILWVTLSLWLVAAGTVAERQGRKVLAFLALMIGVFSSLVVIAYLQDVIKSRRT
jgi:FtsH-binding integral membrane protein